MQQCFLNGCPPKPMEPVLIVSRELFRLLISRTIILHICREFYFVCLTSVKSSFNVIIYLLITHFKGLFKLILR